MQPHKSILFFLKILFSIQTSPPPHFFIGHPSWHLRLPLSSPPFLLHICQTPINVFISITFSSCITTRPSSPLRSSSLTSFSNLLPRTRKGAARMVLPPANIPVNHQQMATILQPLAINSEEHCVSPRDIFPSYYV